MNKRMIKTMMPKIRSSQDEVWRGLADMVGGADDTGGIGCSGIAGVGVIDLVSVVGVTSSRIAACKSFVRSVTV